jgi:hypothetical protein
VADAAVVAATADLSDLVRAEGRILGLERQDAAANVCRQQTPVVGGALGGVEEASHARGVEAIGLAVQCSLGHAHDLGPRCSSLAEEHDGPEHLVRFLLRPADEEAQLLPVVRRRAARAFG